MVWRLKVFTRLAWRNATNLESRCKRFLSWTKVEPRWWYPYSIFLLYQPITEISHRQCFTNRSSHQRSSACKGAAITCPKVIIIFWDLKLQVEHLFAHCSCVIKGFFMSQSTAWAKWVVNPISIPVQLTDHEAVILPSQNAGSNFSAAQNSFFYDCY